MIALYDHIQELRAELDRPSARHERARIEAELAQALVEQAVLDRELDRALNDAIRKDGG
jgi:hypothetical protein